jgi:hypothetical protein
MGHWGMLLDIWTSKHLKSSGGSDADKNPGSAPRHQYFASRKHFRYVADACGEPKHSPIEGVVTQLNAQKN